MLLGGRELAAQPTRFSGPATALGLAGAVGTTTTAPTTTSVVTTTSSTTTTVATALIAAWMLDEASGARVDWKGNAANNLAGGSVGNDTTNKMEGTASALFTGSTTNLNTSSSNALRFLPEPFSCVIWARQTSGSGIKEVLFNAGSGTGWALEYDWSVVKYRVALNTPSSVLIPASNTNAANAWFHVAVTRSTGSPGTTSLYINGVIDAGTASAFVTNGGTEFALGANSGSASMIGQLDEAACYTGALSPAAVCRICSCGVRGEQCTCSGATFTSTGRNAGACGSCALPADCSASLIP